ncbi:MAG TPA: hypothetical protein DEV81_10520 [Cyanobacteria bacterium UBA11049]|nr:hypothetical protein [Cyanobacteria bacterium UBA11049]
MKQIISRLRNFGIRRIITICLAAVTFLLVPAVSQSASLQAQAAELRNPGEYNPVTPDTVKRIQEKAEDLGDAPGRRIGDTGLENIKQIPEKIPQVIDLNVRQQSAKYNPNDKDKVRTLEKAQEKVEKD